MPLDDLHPVIHTDMDCYTFADPGGMERLSWPSWLIHSGQFTDNYGYVSTTDRLQGRESQPAKE